MTDLQSLVFAQLSSDPFSPYLCLWKTASWGDVLQPPYRGEPCDCRGRLVMIWCSQRFPLAIFPSWACDEKSKSIAQWYDLMFIRLWGTRHGCYFYHAVSEGKPVVSVPWSSKLMNRWWLLCFWGLQKTYLHSKKILSFVIATVVVTLQVCCDEAIPLYDQKIHYGKYDVAKGLQELITLYGVTLHLLCLCFDSCLLCYYSHLLISIYIVAEWLLHF